MVEYGTIWEGCSSGGARHSRTPPTRSCPADHAADAGPGTPICGVAVGCRRLSIPPLSTSLERGDPHRVDALLRLAAAHYPRLMLTTLAPLDAAHSVPAITCDSLPKPSSPSGRPPRTPPSRTRGTPPSPTALASIRSGAHAGTRRTPRRRWATSEGPARGTVTQPAPRTAAAPAAWAGGRRRRSGRSGGALSRAA